jgi:hypothetical protein
MNVESTVAETDPADDMSESGVKVAFPTPSTVILDRPSPSPAGAALIQRTHHKAHI